MNICFFTKHDIGWGSSWERIGGYLDYLKEKGHTYKIVYCIPERLSRVWIGKENKYSPYKIISSFWYWRVLKHLKLIWIIIIAKRFDVILVQKISLLYPLVWLLSLRNKNIMFDFDDQCFCELNSTAINKISLARRIRVWRTGIQHPGVLRLYKKVIAGNGYLADLANLIKQREDIYIIPTPIDCDLYQPRERNQEGLPIIIGWSGSGENHLRHLELLVGPFKELKKQCVFTFKLVGAMYSERVRGLFDFLGPAFVCIDWARGRPHLAEIIQSFDIGVMPLRDDDESRGKCGFKALQYMACGIPVVVSPVGVNKEIVKEGENGFLAGNSEEWVDKLLTIIRSRNLQELFSKRGRKTAQETYSRDVLFPKWLGVFTGDGANS